MKQKHFLFVPRKQQWMFGSSTLNDTSHWRLFCLQVCSKVPVKFSIKATFSSDLTNASSQAYADKSQEVISAVRDLKFLATKTNDLVSVCDRHTDTQILLSQVDEALNGTDGYSGACCVSFS